MKDEKTVPVEYPPTLRWRFKNKSPFVQWRRFVWGLESFLFLSGSRIAFRKLKVNLAPKSCWKKNTFMLKHTHTKSTQTWWDGTFD